MILEVGHSDFHKLQNSLFFIIPCHSKLKNVIVLCYLYDDSILSCPVFNWMYLFTSLTGSEMNWNSKSFQFSSWGMSVVFLLIAGELFKWNPFAAWPCAWHASTWTHLKSMDIISPWGLFLWPVLLCPVKSSNRFDLNSPLVNLFPVSAVPIACPPLTFESWQFLSKLLAVMLGHLLNTTWNVM
jgi:hypothetical protein